MDSIKGALLSKTVWFNGLLTILGGLDWITNHQSLIATLFPQVGPVLAIVGPIGIILRFMTSKPLAEKAG